MIDTHSHIYLEEFDSDRDAAIARARSAGVRHLVMPNVDLGTIPAMLAVADAYPSYTSVAMGLHPTSVGADFASALERTRAELERRSYVAIGEVGIDLYWDATFRREQTEAFREQLRWAEELGLPVIIHCREGLDDILGVFGSYGGTLPRCVFHSFGGTAADVERIRRHGDFFFGINGVVTFKNSRLWESLPGIGIDRILLETDCPYLAPVPLRGRRNESAYVAYVAEKIAQTLSVSIEEVSETTDRNAAAFFGLEL